jgi:sugar transferase (PEP-CTERM system associated)
MTNSLILAAVDALIAFIAVQAGFFIRFGAAEIPDDIHVLRVIIFSAVTLISTYFLELYNFRRIADEKELLARVFIAVITSFFIMTVIGYVIHTALFFRGMLFVTLIVFVILQYLWHVSYRSVMRSKGMALRVLVLGTGPLAKKMGDLILSTNNRYILDGYVNPTGESIQVPLEDIVGNGGGLIERIKQNNVDKLVVSLSERRGVFPLQDVMCCKFTGVEVIDAPTFYEEITEKLLIENTTPSWFIFSNGFKMTYPLRLFKRAVDIVCSIFGLILATPMLPLIALMIKIDSRGPVFLKQIRVGEMEKQFLLYKFRSMRCDAETGCGAVWSKKDDPRITRIGKFLRKTRIDELPQLFNVLKGDMSLVGPRPERPEFIDELKKQIPYYSERHFVKPGVTGWAQIRYPYGASVEDTIEKLRYDLYYIKNISLFLDTVIILETGKVMLFGRGGR